MRVLADVEKKQRKPKQTNEIKLAHSCSTASRTSSLMQKLKNIYEKGNAEYTVHIFCKGLKSLQ